MLDDVNMARRRDGVQSVRETGTMVVRSTEARRAARAALVACVAVLGCGDGAPAGAGSTDTFEADRPLTVVATIFPVADLVARAGGDRVETRVLLGPGASPATFEATPSALRTVEGADLLIEVGGGLDGWAGEVMDVGTGATMLTLLEGVPLLDDGHEHEGNTGNPHVWLDPVRVRDQLLPRIVAGLIHARPEYADSFEDGGRALADSLTTLDAEIRAALAPLESRAFVASHPAWTYFAERYDLRQLGVVHERPGQEPSPRALAALVADARAAGVPVVFTEPQLPDQGARAIAGELGVPLLPLDPLGSRLDVERNSYFSLMRYNTSQLVRGLGGLPPGP